MKKNKNILKRSDRIRLTCSNLNDIFTGLKHNKGKKDCIENFLFIIDSDIDFLEKEIIIPKHNKYIRFKNSFENFNKLFNFMEENKFDNEIIPFNGEDLTLREKPLS